MKCSKCGAEIDAGSVFCKKCGKPVQMVPDYNILEDDFLVSLLEEEKSAGKMEDQLETAGQNVQAGKKTSVGGKSASAAQKTVEEKPEKKKGFAGLWANKKARAGLIGGIIALCLVLILLTVYMTSYDHYVAKGKTLDAKEDYTGALTYYNRAIEKNDTKTKAKILAANDYIKLEEYDTAESLLLEVIGQDDDNVSAYKSLIVLYLTTGDYDKLTYLQTQTSSQKVLDLFNDNLLSAPVFSIDGGKYDDDVTIELSCKTGKIYYTLDGSDPTEGGILYTEAFTLEEGTTTVKAVCENDDKTSQVVEKKYKITYADPDYPVVTPSGGSFTTPTTITVEVPEGASVYYTWDGTAPTQASAKYTGPIEMMEGNNILSLILVDKHGKTSDVLECNYKYIPQ